MYQRGQQQIKSYFCKLAGMKSCIGLLVLVSVLSGCGREGAQGSQTDLQETPKEKIAALESSGEIPKLDRGIDIIGPDTNKNGVRDDIEAYIEKNYPEAAQRAAVMQLANAMQETMVIDTSNRTSAKAVELKIGTGIHCIYLKFKGDNNSKNPSQVTDEIEAITTNTKQRLIQYLRFNKALNGSVLSSPEGDTCE